MVPSELKCSVLSRRLLGEVMVLWYPAVLDVWREADYGLSASPSTQLSLSAPRVRAAATFASSLVYIHVGFRHIRRPRKCIWRLMSELLIKRCLECVYMSHERAVQWNTTCSCSYSRLPPELPIETFSLTHAMRHRAFKRRRI